MYPKIAAILSVAAVGLAIILWPPVTRLGQDPTATAIGFHFEILEDQKSGGSLGDPLRVINVLLSKDDYSRENLERMFRYFSTKYPNQDERLRVRVFTSRENWKRYLERLEKEGFINILDASPTDPTRRLLYYDAVFTRQGDLFGSAGREETYSYSPDLSNPNYTKAVWVRGPTPPGVRDIIDEWVSGGAGSLTFRVLTYKLRGYEPEGVYGTIEAKNAESRGWKELTTSLIAEGDLLTPSERVRFVSRDIAYVFLGGTYFATLDGGRSWLHWSVDEGGCCKGHIIAQVQIETDGHGEMKLVSGSAGRTVLYLKTKSFGRDWREK